MDEGNRRDDYMLNKKSKMLRRCISSMLKTRLHNGHGAVSRLGIPKALTNFDFCSDGLHNIIVMHSLQKM